MNASAKHVTNERPPLPPLTLQRNSFTLKRSEEGRQQHERARGRGRRRRERQNKEIDESCGLESVSGRTQTYLIYYKKGEEEENMRKKTRGGGAKGWA